MVRSQTWPITATPTLDTTSSSLPGTRVPNRRLGPYFKFEDVNVFDLNLTGAKIPDSVGEGDRFRFVAQVGKYNQTQCLLFLESVETKVR